MIPVLEPLIRFSSMQLLNLVRSEVVGRTEVATGSLPNSREIAVCFADLTAFTRLGQTLHPEARGDLVRGFEELVQETTPRPHALSEPLRSWVEPAFARPRIGLVAAVRSRPRRLLHPPVLSRVIGLPASA